MIFIFHGENQPALRDALLQLKGKYSGHRLWEGEAAHLSSALNSVSIFGQELIILESPSLGDAGKFFKSWTSASQDLAVTFPRALKQGELTKFSSAKIYSFKEEIPRNAFGFLDAISARNRGAALSELKRLRKDGVDVDYLIKMLGWNLRNLVQVKGGETSRMSPYVAGKLKKWQGKWGETDLPAAYRALLKEDQRQKKGKKVPFDFLISRLTK